MSELEARNAHLVRKVAQLESTLQAQVDEAEALLQRQDDLLNMALERAEAAETAAVTAKKRVAPAGGRPAPAPPRRPTTAAVQEPPPPPPPATNDTELLKQRVTELAQRSATDVDRFHAAMAAAEARAEAAEARANRSEAKAREAREAAAVAATRMQRQVRSIDALCGGVRRRSWDLALWRRVERTCSCEGGSWRRARRWERVCGASRSCGWNARSCVRPLRGRARR
jgi:DNA repair exonuclease SbcCD ATPase subunit